MNETRLVLCPDCQVIYNGGECLGCRFQKAQARNKLLKDRLREFAGNILMILENDTTLDLDTKNRLEYEFKQTEQDLKEQ